MTVGSLFSGIGGLDLGLEWAGFETKWFCEIEKFPQAVLRKHWPNVPIIEDVRDVTSRNVQRVDVIAGGFPCQDISIAGRRSGLDGSESGLWYEQLRCVDELRPKYVIVENSPSLFVRGIDRILGGLSELGYDAEWECIPAAITGSPHLRARAFLLAYPSCQRHGPPSNPVFAGRVGPELCGGWPPEPGVGRVADGIPRRVDRLRALGNAVVPQVGYLVGRAVRAHAEENGWWI